MKILEAKVEWRGSHGTRATPFQYRRKCYFTPFKIVRPMLLGNNSIYELLKIMMYSLEKLAIGNS